MVPRKKARFVTQKDLHPTHPKNISDLLAMPPAKAKEFVAAWSKARRITNPKIKKDWDTTSLLSVYARENSKPKKKN